MDTEGTNEDNFGRSLKILIAEDDLDIAESYKRALEARGHEVIVVDNGEKAIEIYKEEFENTKSRYLPLEIELIPAPFDAVVLDYKMPKVNGMEVAKAILALQRHQRIIFASAYVRDTLEESVRELNQVVELMQKPFGEKVFVETVEDTEVYTELKKLNVDVQALRTVRPTHHELATLLDNLRRISKGRTF